MKSVDYIDRFIGAAARGNIAVVSQLIDSGINVNKYAKCGNLALHISASFGHLQVVRILIKNGADVNQVLKQNGNTALHSVIIASDLEVNIDNNHALVAKELIFAGADLDKMNYDGKTIMNLLETHGSDDVFEIIYNISREREDRKREDYVRMKQTEDYWKRERTEDPTEGAKFLCS